MSELERKNGPSAVAETVTKDGRRIGTEVLFSAKEEIYALIRDMTDEGKAVIVLGDTTDECIGLCSRLLVMKDGLVTGEFDAPADHKPSQVDVVSLMM